MLDKNNSDLINEVENSSTLRLVRELTRWDLDHHKKELSVVLIEIRNRDYIVLNLLKLFLICLIQSNLLHSFSENFHVFDEDEIEVRRQLRLGITTHISTLLLFSFIYFITPILSVIMALIYLLLVFVWAVSCFTPIRQLIRKN